MNILMTGMQGFIGTHLKNRLFLKGNNITGYDTKIGKDISDFKLTADTDLVIHLAAFADVRASIENPNKYWRNNVNYTTKIQKECHRKSVPLLYASSSCVHAWHKSPYGISKKVNEETALERQVGLRFTTVFGKGARDTMLIPRILRNDVPYVNTNHWRDFIHVDDVCSAINTLISSTESIVPFGDVIDIGTGEIHKLTDILQYFKIDTKEKLADESERILNKANISFLKSLGWSPEVNLRKYITKNRRTN